MTLTRADLLVLWSRSVDHDGPNHPLTHRLHAAYEAAPPETNDDEEGGAENDTSGLVRP